MDLRYERGEPPKPCLPTSGRHNNQYVLDDDFDELVEGVAIVLDSDYTDELILSHTIIRQYDPNDWNFTDTCSYCRATADQLFFIEYHSSNTLLAYCEQCARTFVDEGWQYIEQAD